jgi:site-specific DNA-methyltransferase (adenine-specific)
MNTYCAKFGIHYITEEQASKMNFDVVVGNPPYTNGTKDIYKDFFWKFFNTAPCYAIIIPSKWVNSETDKLRNQILNDPHVQYIQNVTEYFPTVTHISIVAIVKNPNYENTIKTVISSCGDSYKLPGQEIMSFLPNGIQATLVQKMLSGKSSLAIKWVTYNNSGYRSRDAKTTGKYKIVVTAGRATNAEPEIGYVDNHIIQANEEKWKVIFSKSGQEFTLRSIKIVEPGVLLGGQICALLCDSQSEAENLKSYLHSNVVSFIFKTHKEHVENSKGVFRVVPSIDFSRSWTDAELYDHFKLTAEEIQLIEDTIK